MFERKLLCIQFWRASHYLVIFHSAGTWLALSMQPFQQQVRNKLWKQFLVNWKYVHKSLRYISGASWNKREMGVFKAWNKFSRFYRFFMFLCSGGIGQLEMLFWWNGAERKAHSLPDWLLVSQSSQESLCIILFSYHPGLLRHSLKIVTSPPNQTSKWLLKGTFPSVSNEIFSKALTIHRSIVY